MQNLSIDTRWKWIKHRLSLQGLNFNKLGRLYNCHRTCFTGLKKKHHPKFERILCNILKIQPHELFPERYPKFSNFLAHTKQESNGKNCNGQ